jgi:hypothetical protein
MMRVAFALAILIGTTWTAWAGANGPYIVIPGRPGVPIIINGVDASYSVVEGDWGLGRGIHVQPTVYGGRFVDTAPSVGHYYPSSGHLPGYGRLEIEPPSSGKPRAAQSFHQSWSAESMPQPEQPAVPLYPPPVITAPPDGEGGGFQNFANPPRDFRDRKPGKIRP